MGLYYRVRVGGIDVSSLWAPRLQQLEISLSDESEADAARFVFEDAAGDLALPPDRTSVSVDIGTDAGIAHVFDGFADVPRGEGARGSGRELHVEAKSADPRGKGKAPRERHWDRTTVGDALREAGGDADITMRVHPDLDGIARDYLAMDGASFEGWAAAVAEDLGATFKVMGSIGLLVPRNSGLSATGKALVPISAVVGSNLERWSLTPARAKTQWRRVRMRTWDPKKARYVEKEAQVEEASDAAYVSLRPAEDETEADGRAKGGARKSEREKGEGSVTILGHVAAQPGAPVTVSGVRPGLDGSYLASTVRHQMSRGEGFTTTLELRRPDGTKDTRKAG